SVSPDIHSLSNGAQTRKQGDKTENKDKGKSPVITITGFRDLNAEFEECTNNSSNGVNVASSSVSTAGHNFINSTNDFSATDMPNMKDLTHSDDADDVGVEADINNLESIISVSPILTTKIHKDHLTSQIIGDLSSTTQTRSMARVVKDQGGLSQMFNEDFHTCMFACFLSQEEPKRVNQALKDPSWIEAMQEKLLQFKMQKVWILVDLRYGKMAIGTKWVYRNKKDERGIVIRNKARLVAQGHTQEKGIDYEEFFAPVAGLKLLDWFEDPENPDKVYKVVKALYGLHQVPRAWSSGKSASTPIDAEKPLLKDSDGKDVDVHTYSDPKVSHLNAVKRIFRYLKGKPYLGLWYTKDSPFDLVAYSDSDYAGASLDKKSTTGGCQFLRCRLISCQCKKQTVVATSLTEAEYIAVASGCAQVLWIQNQLLDYGYNFMHTVINIDNRSCSLRNMVIEIVVLNILSDAFPITTNGAQLTMSNPQERVDSP
nr:hypothetical protein [Tanacetum cinerariifolium]